MLTPRIHSHAPRRSRRSTRRPRAFPCSARRLRQRTHDAAAAAARPARPHGRAVHRRRAHRDDARAVPARGHRRRRRSRPATSAPAAARAPRSTPRSAFFDRARDRRRRAGDVPARRVPRVPDVRELSRACAACCTICVDGLAASGNRFVLTSRYIARTLRLLRDRSSRFEVIHMPALTAEDTLDMLGPPPALPAADAHDADYLARTVQALTDGRPAYVRALADELTRDARARRPRRRRPDQRARRAAGARRPPGAAVRASATSCGCIARAATARSRRSSRSSAEEEGLTLTEISQRLQRTPGSTKDYLSWLEDVDLVTSRQKRYSFTDPLLRVWVRLHCRADRADRRRPRARGAPLRAAAPAAAAEAGARDGRRPASALVDDERERLGHHRDRLKRDRSARLATSRSLVSR